MAVKGFRLPTAQELKVTPLTVDDPVVCMLEW